MRAKQASSLHAHTHISLDEYMNCLTAERPLLLWNGKQTPGNGKILPVHNPATGEQIAQVHTASEEDVAQAVEAANRRFHDGCWSRAPRQHRANVLHKVASLLGSPSFALRLLTAFEIQQTGQTRREVMIQTPSLMRCFQYYAELLRNEERVILPTMGEQHNWVDREPLGVVALVAPCNNPLLTAVKKLTPALAAGNSVVLKPSELTPVTSLLLGPILEEAGVPAGVFVVLPGPGATVGRALVSHGLIRKVDVTAGVAAGRTIGSIVGSNLARCTVNLSGKAPMIVFEKSAVDAAIKAMVYGSFIGRGQMCAASTRMLVHNSILDEVRLKLKIMAQYLQKRMGSPINAESLIGPVISAKKFQTTETLVRSALANGAHLVHGGERMSGTSPLDGTDFDKGYFYPPTIIDLGSTSNLKRPLWKETNSGPAIATRLWCEEVFGPVIVLAGFDTEAQALELANDTGCSLGAALWTTDLSQAFRVSQQIRAGTVWINKHHGNDQKSPWGGMSASGGVDMENTVEAYHAYTMTKNTIISYAPTPESLALDGWFKEDAGKV